jgi:hypothetical protein
VTMPNVGKLVAAVLFAAPACDADPAASVGAVVPAPCAVTVGVLA